jgi:hypothetical protein
LTGRVKEGRKGLPLPATGDEKGAFTRDIATPMPTLRIHRNPLILNAKIKNMCFFTQIICVHKMRTNSWNFCECAHITQLFINTAITAQITGVVVVPDIFLNAPML